ncbi:MAG: succinylglutamate desuccinylase/aspartoacylase family protein [Magnetococcus sp. WYHC-3]
MIDHQLPRVPSSPMPPPHHPRSRTVASGRGWLFFRFALPCILWLLAGGTQGMAADDENTGPCQRIGAKLASVTVDDCLTLGLTPSGGRSVEGFPLLLREFLPAPGRLPQARILFLGGIHGDEYSSVSIVFRWLRMLEQEHTGRFHWRVLPLTNPDGLLRPQSQRVNARGVDLNRNFFTDNWTVESATYWERRTGRDPRRYPGPSPLSEPESRWIAQEIETFRPNVIISVHAPFGLLDFDGPPANPPQRLGSLYLSLLGTYPGSLGRYAGVQLRIPVITIELAQAGALPNRQEIRKIWTDLVGWIGRNIQDHEPEAPLRQPLILETRVTPAASAPTRDTAPSHQATEPPPPTRQELQTTLPVALPEKQNASDLAAAWEADAGIPLPMPRRRHSAPPVVAEGEDHRSESDAPPLGIPPRRRPPLGPVSRLDPREPALLESPIPFTASTPERP